ncbi:hypothetical protein WJX81_005082 [Elliptochloris bilobata]|uniref:RING-type E3 ubiquitin transferase n=1 Tax=Elliptochloris bilobata TaxID=381761 RepID=A0AAW1RE81_9CHLO
MFEEALCSRADMEEHSFTAASNQNSEASSAGLQRPRPPRYPAVSTGTQRSLEEVLAEQQRQAKQERRRYEEDRRKREVEARAAAAAAAKGRARQQAELEAHAKLLQKQREEERRRLREMAGLAGKEDNDADEQVGRCQLRSPAQGACPAAGDSYAIRGKELRIEVTCSEGCGVCFHYPACWHAFERLHKADHPKFSFKSKVELACLTPSCKGVLTRAVVLGGKDGAQRELYSHPLPKKPKPEPQPKATAALAVPARKGNKKRDAGEAEASPGKGMSPERAALRGRDGQRRQGGMHANGAEARVDRKPAPVPLPGSPAQPGGPSSGTDWMEHELKAQAEPESPKNSYVVEDVKPKGIKKDKVKRGKKVLEIDVKFKDGPGEEAEPGDIITRGAQARSPERSPPIETERAPANARAAGLWQPVQEASPPRAWSVFKQMESAGDLAALSQDSSSAFGGGGGAFGGGGGAVGGGGGGGNGSQGDTIQEALSALKLDGDKGPSAVLLLENIPLAAMDKPEMVVRTLMRQAGLFKAYAFFSGPAAAAAAEFDRPDVAKQAFKLLHGYLLERDPLRAAYLVCFPTDEVLAQVAAGLPPQRSVGATNGAGRPAPAAPMNVPRCALKATAKEFLPSSFSSTGSSPIKCHSPAATHIAAPAAKPAIAAPAPAALALQAHAPPYKPLAMDGSASPHAHAPPYKPSALDGPVGGVEVLPYKPPAMGGVAAQTEAPLPAELAAIQDMQVLGCDDDNLVAYRTSTNGFGIWPTDLAQPPRWMPGTTAMVLHHVERSELHGIWRAEVEIDVGGSAMAIKFTPILATAVLPLSVYAGLLTSSSPSPGSMPTLLVPQRLQGAPCHTLLQLFAAAAAAGVDGAGSVQAPPRARSPLGAKLHSANVSAQTKAEQPAALPTKLLSKLAPKFQLSLSPARTEAPSASPPPAAAAAPDDSPQDLASLMSNLFPAEAAAAAADTPSPTGPSAAPSAAAGTPARAPYCPTLATRPPAPLRPFRPPMAPAACAEPDCIPRN